LTGGAEEALVAGDDQRVAAVVPGFDDERIALMRLGRWTSSTRMDDVARGPARLYPTAVWQLQSRSGAPSTSIATPPV